MRNKLGIVCMVLGAALILAALSLFLWNREEDRKAGLSVNRILPKLIEQLDGRNDGTDLSSNYPDPYDDSMTEVEIDGYGYIGYLCIPSLNLELPVMSEWDYTRMKLAPCRYSGGTKTDNLVIAAHNYTRHFGTLSRLSAGDKVYFIDVDGVTHYYKVQELEMLAATSVEDMTAGEFDLSLFTCNYSGQSRLTVRCDRAAEE